MRKLQVTLPANREPWLIPTASRISLAYRALQQGKRLCLMVYDHADTSTFRYRCYNMQQWTEQSSAWQAVYFYSAEINTVFDLLPRSSLLILARLQWYHAVDLLIHKAHAQGISVLYDTDDYIVDLDILPTLTNSTDVDFSAPGQYEYWFSYISRNGYTAGKTDGFITTNDYLGQKLKNKFGKPYRVITNSLNREQLEVSQRCRAEKERQRDGGDMTLGYFSGSPSHNHDLELIASELAAFLGAHKNASLRVVGFMQFPAALQPFIRNKQIVFSPLTDFLSLQTLTAAVDVNIVPLLDNGFTNCKSELKYFEAGAVDTVTAATPTYVFTKCIHPGGNGFLCRPGEWFDTLESLYRRKNELKSIADAARRDSLERYSGANFIRSIEQTYDDFTKDISD
ncbi:MAG: glycosyltransferase [Clostridia bacterium]|nr:glycosyltransferase [Clostridia bacterium]